jgi:DNA-binding XRE family transcriptional regulator
MLGTYRTMTTDMNKALIAAREKANLNKAQLEALAKLSPGTIYDLETRRDVPAYDTGAQILAVLKAHGVPQRLLDRVFPVEDVVGAKR